MSQLPTLGLKSGRTQQEGGAHSNVTSLHASVWQEREAAPQLHPTVCSVRNKQIWGEERLVTMETLASVSAGSLGTVQELRSERRWAGRACQRRAGVAAAP